VFLYFGKFSSLDDSYQKLHMFFYAFPLKVVPVFKRHDMKKYSGAQMAVRGQLYDPSTLTPWESASTDST
jgi:hypothetical protein